MTQQTTPGYSKLFSCLYDEPAPIGRLTVHHSIFRCVEPAGAFFQATRPYVHDFAVLWDQDHDDRVIAVAEQMLMAGLMAPVFALGERKATLTVWYNPRFFENSETRAFDTWKAEIEAIAESGFHDDYWTVVFEEYVSYNALGGAEVEVDAAVRWIDYRWGLGIRPFARSDSSRPIPEGF